MISLTSNNLLMIQRSMEYLWTKQAAHLDNIANAETPGYKVKTVTFEEKFRTKLRMAKKRAVGYHGSVRGAYREAIQDAKWEVNDDEEITRMDENGVNVTEQLTEAIRTAYQIQYVMQTISNDLSLTRTAIGST